MEVKQPKPIVIDNWQKGIALSGELGFSDMRNVDNNILPGLLFNSSSAVKKSGTTITGLPMWAVQNNDANGTIYVLDNAQKVYSSTITGADPLSTWSLVTHASASTGHGNGMAIFNDYLIIAGDAALDIYGPLSGSAGWTNGWKTLLSDTSVHPMFLSTNGYLYIGDGVDTTNKLGASIAALHQNSGQVFAPGTGATFTWQQGSSNALQLPYPYRIRCLSQLGNNLMIGTFIGTTNSGDIISNQTDNVISKIADIFPWDRTSATYNLPIRLYESGVNWMIMVNNQLYISVGQVGNFYKYNGYLATKWFQFPADTTATRITQYDPVVSYPQSVTYHQGRFFFGITKGGALTGASGVYSINPEGTGLTMDNLISTGTSISTTYPSLVMSIRDLNVLYIIGWQDATGQGIDRVSNLANPSSDYSSFTDTQWYEIGTVDKPGTLGVCNILLETALTSGDGIRISYRYDKSTSFTTLVTADFTTYAGTNSITYPASIISGRKVQFRIALALSPRLQKITFTR